MDPDPASCIFLIMAIDVSVVFSFALLFLLLLCSALISGAEVALFSLKRNDVEEGLEQKSKRIEIIAKLLESPKKL
ncbi:CNNM domain-containing protein, partial [uncultured Algibacter sp.]|uniref:CNNM domain-containing protein n=1 Tax=uncultured Algibacter sp. TaxID=298659 RepID=UPI0025D6B94C